MVSIVNIEKCDGCSDCTYNCPVLILEVVDGKIKVIDSSLCTECGLCVQYCPQEGVLEIA